MMQQPPKTELFSNSNKHAMYAVDIITRMVKRLDHEDRTPEALKDILGEELWNEVCHAIGWDIDWDQVYQNGQVCLDRMKRISTHQHQHRFYYCGQSANEAGENRHPQIVVRELAAKHGFKIIGAVPQTITCGWDFWIEMVNGGPAPILTAFFKAASWKPVGEA